MCGFRGLASLGPFLGAPAGSPGQVKYAGGTGSGAWHPLTPSWVPSRGVPVPQIMSVRGGGTACGTSQVLFGQGYDCPFLSVLIVCWGKDASQGQYWIVRDMDYVRVAFGALNVKSQCSWAVEQNC